MAEKVKVIFINQENHIDTVKIFIVQINVFLHFIFMHSKKNAYIFLLSLSLSVSEFLLVMHMLNEERDRRHYHNCLSSTWQSTVTA